MAEDGGTIRYTVEADTADLLTGQKNADAFVDTVTTSMKRADSAVNSFRNELRNLGRTVSSTGKVMTAFGKVDEEATKQLQRLEAQSKLTRYQSQGIGTSMTRTASAVRNATNGFKMMQGGGRNLSYQLQDVIVQLQMGTNLFTIIAQQGPQIASIFGGMGAGLGVLIALVGIAGPALMKAFNNGESAAKELEKEMKRINAVITLSKDGTAEYSQEVQRLAAFSREAARSLLQLTMARQIDATTQAAKQLQEQFTGVFNVLQRIGNWQATSREEVVKLTTRLVDVRKATEGLENSPREYRERFEEVVSSVGDLQKAIQGVQAGPTEKNVRALLSALEGIQVQGEFTTKASRDLANNIYQMANAFLTGQMTVKALKDQLQDLNAGGLVNWDVKGTEDQQKAVNDVLNELYLTQDQLGKTSTEQQLLSIQNQVGAKAWRDYGDAITYAVQQSNSAGIDQQIKDNAKDLEGANIQLRNGAIAYARWKAARDAAQSGATPDQSKQLQDQAEAQEKLNQAQQGRGLSQTASLSFNYETNSQNLYQAYQQDLVSHQEYIAAKKKLDDDYNQNYERAYLQTQGVAGQLAISALDNLAQAGANAFATMLSGSGSLEDSMRGLAQTIIQSVLQALIQTAVQYTLLPALAQAFGMAQASAAATSAAASSAAAATTATATSAAAATTAAASAPAAAATATWSFGTAALIGAAALGSIFLLSKSLSGGRRYGGGVSAGNMYQVNESGVPEVYSYGNRDYLMNTRNASITPLGDMGGGGGISVNINNYASDQVSISANRNGNSIDINAVYKDVKSRLTREVNSGQGDFVRSIQSMGNKR